MLHARVQKTSALTVTIRNVPPCKRAYWRVTLAKKNIDCKSCPTVRRPVKWVAKRKAKGFGQVRTKYLCDKCVKKLPGDWMVARYE